MHCANVVPVLHDGPPDIELWRVDIAFNASLEGEAFATLSHDELARARAFHHKEDALRFATVRAVLRRQLASKLGAASNDLRFMRDAMGRPHLSEPALLDFNVSHSGAHGMIALSGRRRIGVDIEERLRDINWRALARLTLDDREVAWLEQQPADTRIDRFYDAWVAKEALLKTTGAGVTRGLLQVPVLPRDGVHVVLHDPIASEGRSLSAVWVDAPDHYAACVAWSKTSLLAKPD